MAIDIAMGYELVVDDACPCLCAQVLRQNVLESVAEWIVGNRTLEGLEPTS